MKYYIAENGNQVGPLEINQLLSRGVTVNTLVWHEGMTEWAPAGSVPELAQLLGAAPVPPQQPQQPNYAPQQPNYAPQQPVPPTHLVGAILVTLFCCLPFGIVAIIKAANTSSAISQGNYEQAAQSSAEAMKWIKWSIICGVIYTIIVGAITAVQVIAELN